MSTLDVLEEILTLDTIDKLDEVYPEEIPKEGLTVTIEIGPEGVLEGITAE